MKQQQNWQIVDEKGNILAKTHNRLTAMGLIPGLKISRLEKLMVERIEK